MANPAALAPIDHSVPRAASKEIETARSLVVRQARFARARPWREIFGPRAGGALRCSVSTSQKCDAPRPPWDRAAPPPADPRALEARRTRPSPAGLAHHPRVGGCASPCTPPRERTPTSAARGRRAARLDDGRPRVLNLSRARKARFLDGRLGCGAPASPCALAHRAMARPSSGAMRPGGARPAHARGAIERTGACAACATRRPAGSRGSFKRSAGRGRRSSISTARARGLIGKASLSSRGGAGALCCFAIGPMRGPLGARVTFR